MKKIIIIVILMLFNSNYTAQTSIFIVNNYSDMTLEGILHANANSGSCYPHIASTNPTGFNIIVSPGTPTNPSTVSYDKYAFANNFTTNFPLTQWWLQSSPTAPGGYRPVTHPSFNPSGPISSNTNWTGFYFVTKNAIGYHEEHPIGNPSYFNCTACYLTYNYAVETESEWFSIGNYTYVQVYDI